MNTDFLFWFTSYRTHLHA